MKKILFCTVIFLSISSAAHATVYNRFLDANKEIEKSPEELMQDFKDGRINSSQLWIRMPLGEQIKLIETLRENFEEDEGVSIKKPAEYYAILLNNLYEEHPEFLTESIKAVFAALAMQSNDFYEEGLSLPESMKKWFGETFLINMKEE